MIDYFREKNAFSSLRYFCTANYEDLVNVDTNEEYTVLRNKYRERKVEPLNLDDFPRFSFSAENAVETVGRILPSIGILCFTGILFFAMAFVSFLRYDAR